MFSVPISAAFVLLLTASFLKNLSAVPVPTTSLPPLPARRYLEPFDKDPFKDYTVDYQDVSKRTLAQHENAKKFSRPWGPPPPEFFESNFFNPTPYKDQDPRGLLETNSIQPNYFEGYFNEDEFAIEEEETNFIEPPYPGDSNYLVEPPQLTYVEPMGSYQPNMGYSSVYVGGDSSNKEDNEIETDTETENNSEEDDNDYDSGGNVTPTTTLQPLLQMFPPNSLFPQKIPQMLPKQVFNADYDSLEVDMKPRQREFRSVKPTTKGNYTPSPTEPKIKNSKEVKLTNAVEEIIKPTEKVPSEKEVFTRTTTITKTTTWYLNENNDVVVKEEINGRPAPLKGKYTKTSKTTTSGPIPWYLQTFEDVIFEEENEKSKTILDKITYLKGMTPTSITSFTTAPNPWSSEVHEEVVLEEDMTKKEGVSELKTASHPSQLEHIVDYLPRSQIVSEEAIVEKNLVEEFLEELLDEEEIILEINIIPDLPPFAPQIIPTMKPYPQYQYPMHPLTAPQATMPEKDNLEEAQDFNGINQNQVTTPKPLTTPPSMDNNFTPHSQITPLQGPEQQMYSQPNFNYAQTTQHPQIYGTNQPQSSGNQGNRSSGKWDSSINRPVNDEGQQDGNRLSARMDQERRDKMNPQGKRQMYSQQQQQQQKGMNRQGRTSRDL